MVNDWKDLHNKNELAGVAPNTYILYNDTSDDSKKAFKHADVKFQLVPSPNHRNNLAERTIHTYKYYIKVSLATFHSNFLLIEWNRPIEQGSIILIYSLHVSIPNHLYVPFPFW